MWNKNCWQDRCIYRPLRDHYKLIEWEKEEFDPLTILDMEEFEYVRDNKTEMPREEEKKEIFRLLNKMK